MYNSAGFLVIIKFSHYPWIDLVFVNRVKEMKGGGEQTPGAGGIGPGVGGMLTSQVFNCSV